jgi:hypothetical protein
MGFASLGVLTSIVRGSIGLQWEDKGIMAELLTVIQECIEKAIEVSDIYCLR